LRRPCLHLMLPLVMGGPSKNQAKLLKPNYAVGARRAVTTTSCYPRQPMHRIHEHATPTRHCPHSDFDLGESRLRQEPAHLRRRVLSNLSHVANCAQLAILADPIKCESIAERKANYIAESVQVWSREIE
jgi:hypothetical protein